MAKIDTGIFKTQNSTSLKNPNYRKKLYTKYSIIDGQLVTHKKQPKLLTTMRAIQKLSKEGFADIPTTNRSELSNANNFLQAIGCTISWQPEDYSLIADQTDKTTIPNPNIADKKSLKGISNEQIKSDDKFKTAADPFYKLDECAPRHSQQQSQNKNTKNEKSIIRLSSDLAKTNLANKRDPTLKQFKR